MVRLVMCGCRVAGGGPGAIAGGGGGAAGAQAPRGDGDGAAVQARRRRLRQQRARPHREHGRTDPAVDGARAALPERGAVAARPCHHSLQRL
eukprot:6388934-Pyramimonas_sp.AAC.1